MMRKTMTRVFTIADYEEEEIWLREQHKNGWKLVNMTVPCFYTFESCEPEDVIYRLDFKNMDQSEEYMQMLKDFGWEYFDQCMGWLYFRKPAGAAESEEEGELFSDNESRVNLVSHVMKTRLLPLAIIFLCCVIPNFVKFVSGAYVGYAGMFLGILFAVLFVIYVVLLVHCGTKLRRIRNKYRMGTGA